MLKLFRVSSPWGPRSSGSNDDSKKGDQPHDSGNGSQGQKSQDSNWQKDSKTRQTNSGTKASKVNKFFDSLFGEGGGGNFSWSGGKNKQNTKTIISFVCLGAVLLWLSTGFYKIDPDENGIVLYFGKPRSISSPGLNYYLPFPIGKVIKKSVTMVNTEDFGSDTSNRNKARSEDLLSQSLMLTGDENIVDIDFQVQWQISDIKQFVFSVANPENTIRRSSESAMREVIARTPIVSALSDGKSKIETDARELLQTILDSYQMGVRVTIVQLLRVDPPEQVIDSFRDVQAARADREKEINQAEAYSNDVIPRARGEAAQMLEQAQAYKQEVVAHATGQAERFLSVYNQYINAKTVTKKRMYIERMGKVYTEIDKVIVDTSVPNSLIQYFPIKETLKQSSAKQPANQTQSTQ